VSEPTGTTASTGSATPQDAARQDASRQDAARQDAVAQGAGPVGATPQDAGPPDSTALRWLWLSAGVIVVDQITKAVIVATFREFERIELLPIFEITRLHNTGAAFSMLHDAGGWQHYLFVVLAIGVSGGIAWWLSKLRFRANRWLAAGLALIAGGAVGNVIDRLMHGHVVDFLHFHWYESWYFPAFNVADTAITIGAGLLILDSLLESRRAVREPGAT
jgi:signal peptidase II